MSDLNRVLLIGRLVRDPELKQVKDNSLVNFSIASNGFKKEEVNFFDCTAWNKLADIINQYCKKGKQVAIEGRLKQSVWTDQEGQKRTKVTIEVESLQMLVDQDESEPAKPSPSNGQKPKTISDYLSDDEVF